MTSKVSKLALLCCALLCCALAAHAAEELQGRKLLGSCPSTSKREFTGAGKVRTVRWAKGSGKDSGDCCARCKRTAECRQWTYYHDRFGNAGCAMYNGAASLVKYGGMSTMISGTVKK